MPTILTIIGVVLLFCFVGLAPIVLVLNRRVPTWVKILVCALIGLAILGWFTLCGAVLAWAVALVLSATYPETPKQ